MLSTGTIVECVDGQTIPCFVLSWEFRERMKHGIDDDPVTRSSIISQDLEYSTVTTAYGLTQHAGAS